MDTKKCSRCNRREVAENFKQCLSCLEYGRSYAENNREAKRERNRQWTRNNPEKRKEWKQNNPEKVKEANDRARAKASEERYYRPLCEYDVQLCKKSQHEKGTFHQENVRKQTHPEEFENEHEPDSKYYDNEGRKFYSCSACRCTCIFPYQWRPHIRSEAHIHNKAGKLPFRIR